MAERHPRAIRDLPPPLGLAVETVTRGETGPLNRTSLALASSLTAKLGGAALYGFVVCSTNVAAQFVQVHDASAVPANGAIPLFFVPVAAANQVSVSYPVIPRIFDLGLILTNSTTAGTLTIGAADCIFDVQYV